jgi:hypothetical protein
LPFLEGLDHGDVQDVATASTRGAASSIVRMVPPRKMRSACGASAIMSER